MSKTTKTYSAEFKQDAIQYVETHSELTIQAAADNLGVPRDTLYGWIKAYRRKLRAGDGEPIKGNLIDDIILHCADDMLKPLVLLKDLASMQKVQMNLQKSSFGIKPEEWLNANILKSRSLLSTWSTKKELKNIVALNMHHSINMAMAIWATYSI